MTHFDFKTLLPALLQVEDRVSMAHGLESRVPLLDHRLIELAATIPADVKFKDGEMKHVFKRSLGSVVPRQILDRTDKMGFPVPLSDWLRDGAREFVGRRLLHPCGSGAGAVRQPQGARRAGYRAAIRAKALGAALARALAARFPRPRGGVQGAARRVAEAGEGPPATRGGLGFRLTTSAR